MNFIITNNTSSTNQRLTNLIVKPKDIMFTKQLTCLLCLVTGLWLVACNTPEPTPSPPSPTATTTPVPNPATIPPPEVDGMIAIQLGQPFTISIDQPAQLSEKGLSLTFQKILEDSRCPSHVQCVWSGQARISIRISQTDQAPATLEMDTNPSLKQDVVTYEDFQIHLLALKPYPEDVGQHIPAEAYEAAFVITELQ